MNSCLKFNIKIDDWYSQRFCSQKSLTKKNLNYKKFSTVLKILSSIRYDDFLIFIPKEEIKINFFPVISSEDENNLLEKREDDIKADA